MTNQLLFALATKLGLSIFLAASALLVQRQLNRPALSHGIWVMVLAVMLVPAVFPIYLPTPYLFAGSGVVASLDLVQNSANSISISAFILQNWQLGLVVLWVVGALVVGGYSLLRSLQFHRLLTRHVTPVGADLQNLADEMARGLALRKAPRLFAISAQLSPMVWYLGGNARVLVPQSLIASMSRDQLGWIIAHELAHLKRHDHLVRWLEWIACSLFWWNPIVWLARRELRSAEELCCDALVLASLNPRPRSYAESLVMVIDFLSSPALTRSPNFASPAIRGNNTNLIQRRIKMIVSNRIKSGTPRWLRPVLVTAAVLILPLGAFGLADARNTAQDKVRPNTAEPMIQEKAGDQDCNALALRVKKAVADGTISAEQGKLHMAGCAKTAASVDAEMRARLEALLLQIHDALAAGTITEEQAAEKLAALKKSAAKPAVAKKANVDPAEMCSKLQWEIRAAIEAGKITVEQGHEKLAATGCE